jgi:hypothetical protein
MKWLTAKRQVKVLYAVVALATTCGAAMAASDSEQTFCCEPFHLNSPA